MAQIYEQDFRDAIIATKKDAKLVAAAKSDRTYAVENLYKEFSLLTVDRQREIIAAISADNFVAAQWKIGFPLNNFPAAILPDAVKAVGKVLFYSKDEASVRETVRAMKLYQESPFLKQIAAILGESAEVARDETVRVAEILDHPDIFGMLRQLNGLASGEQIVQTIGRVAMLTRDLASTQKVAEFLVSRRYSKFHAPLGKLVEESIFMARDPKSVQQIIKGFTSGGIDVVLQMETTTAPFLSAIRDVAWKTRDAASIRSYLATIAAQK